MLFLAFYRSERPLGKGAHMRWKQIDDEPKVFVLIFETGDEIASVLRQFAKNQGLGGT